MKALFGAMKERDANAGKAFVVCVTDSPLYFYGGFGQPAGIAETCCSVGQPRRQRHSADALYLPMPSLGLEWRYLKYRGNGGCQAGGPILRFGAQLERSIGVEMGHGGGAELIRQTFLILILEPTVSRNYIFLGKSKNIA
jgi:hypothetical protein